MTDNEIAMLAHLPSFIGQQYIAVGDGHELYVAEYGRKGATPVVYLHGGPGAGCQLNELALFESCDLHVIFIDQRGSGRSRSVDKLANNNVNTLVEDIDLVRRALGIHRWYLVGGSSGAMLGWLYSGIYPQYVIAQVYWGMFIPSHQGVEWLLSEKGAGAKQPEQYLTFQNQVNSHSRKPQQLIADYDPLINQHDMSACAAWINWELALAMPNAQLVQLEPRHVSMAQISHHFAKHCYFNGQMMMTMVKDKVKARTVIIQGEYDNVCPSHILEQYLETVCQLNLRYHKVKQAYHSLADPQLLSKVKGAIQAMVNSKRQTNVKLTTTDYYAESMHSEDCLLSGI
ncbi:alpha/beta fold hydrolase [Shewanella maritima]|uniref:alpha/beta fold hydrolase n=1 Tax=Shewanella maritima TaxID=2520507 RepID=UPI003736DCAB